ncbi:MAG: UvrB/UvrC motif-containing protein, partial [Clostridiales bacterium]|nr:UvrB/UvrC motif-containing protein [Clostridiales bacterium]
EGLDIPEVSLVAILDADKEGFLRSDTSLIQTIGRAARNENGTVIMYADTVTGSMKRAISETARRRAIQLEYNEKNGIVPHSIVKEVRDIIEITHKDDKAEKKMTKAQKEEYIAKLDAEMKRAASLLDFETAAALRDKILKLKHEKKGQFNG